MSERTHLRELAAFTVAGAVFLGGCTLTEGKYPDVPAVARCFDAPQPKIDPEAELPPQPKLPDSDDIDRRPGESDAHYYHRLDRINARLNHWQKKDDAYEK